MASNMSNPTLLHLAFHYLEEVINLRMKSAFSADKDTSDNFLLPENTQTEVKNYLQETIGQVLTDQETVILLLALAPHVIPNYWDSIMQQLPQSGDYPELGGIKGKDHRVTLPTGETVLFLLAGDDLAKRFEVQKLLKGDHFFARRRILFLESVKMSAPFMSGLLLLEREYIELFTQGYLSLPKLSSQFPAENIQTKMEWEDLVLPATTLSQIAELKHWVNYGDKLLYDWDMHKQIKPGYRALFYGPPGTGKTLTATLLGKYTGKEVFRIDLSMIVSKYIGETEKNLANLFDKAQDKNWILFFDEADALFGKRTEVKNAHDKYANQEVAYLLQRVEQYPGLVILSSNFKTNIDDAFTRRFNSIVHFPFPNSQDRLALWTKAFPAKVHLEDDVDLDNISRRYELTGANIINVVQYACLYSLAEKTDAISSVLIEKGIQKEYKKEGRVA